VFCEEVALKLCQNFRRNVKEVRKASEGDASGRLNGFHSRVLLKERLDPPHRERHVNVRTAEITFALKHRMFCTKKEMFPSWKMHLVGIHILQLNSCFVRGFLMPRNPKCGGDGVGEGPTS